MSLLRRPRVLFAEAIPSGGAPRDLMQLPSHILQAQGRSYFWEGTGPLSIKLFLGGEAHYRTDGRQFVVDETHYLVLNHAQEYAIHIDSPMPVESFCLFFRAGVAEEVRHSLRENTDRLLDEPTARATDPVTFFARTHPHDGVLSPLLFRLREALYTFPDASACEPGWIEEQMHRVMEGLLLRHCRVRREEREAFSSIIALRAATREELYRRLHYARDFAAALSHQPLTLSDMAREARLSPNHFLRSFKALFQETPHQYLVRRRMESAARLLRGTELSVTEICLRVGFISLGSFSRLFSRRFGLSPERYRRRN